MANPVPNFRIVNADGTPTQYFFGWLLQVRNSVSSIDDLLILQAASDDATGAIAAAVRGAVEEAALGAGDGAIDVDALMDRLGIIAALSVSAPQPDPDPDGFVASAAAFDSSDIELAAAIGDRAPVAEAPPALRGPLASIPGGFNAGDAGRTYYATDFKHEYRWSGSVWEYGDKDEGSGRIAYFAVAPRAGLWQLMDGSLGVTESLANGTTALVAFSGLAAGTMPNLTGTPSYLRSAAACTGVVNAAVEPTISGHTDSGNAVIPPVLAGAGFAQITGSTGNDAGLGQVVQSGTGITVAAHTHTHPTASSVTDSGHQHVVSVSDTGHTHALSAANAPITATGQPRNMDALPYYRL